VVGGSNASSLREMTTSVSARAARPTSARSNAPAR
jgi:hypothetical protein